jgi:CheY-like chemotaxis protein
LLFAFGVKNDNILGEQVEGVIQRLRERQISAQAAPEQLDDPAVLTIALTALVMRGDRERCPAARANEYTSKSVRLKGLIKVIEVQLNRKRVEKRV